MSLVLSLNPPRVTLEYTNNHPKGNKWSFLLRIKFSAGRQLYSSNCPPAAISECYAVIAKATIRHIKPIY